MVARLVVGNAFCLEADTPQNAADLKVAPGPARIIVGREVRELLVMLQIGAKRGIKLAYLPRVDIVSRLFDRDSKMIRGSPVGRPPQLREPIKDHSRGAPVIDRIRKHIDVHEEAV